VGFDFDCGFTTVSVLSECVCLCVCVRVCVCVCIQKVSMVYASSPNDVGNEKSESFHPSAPPLVGGAEGSLPKIRLHRKCVCTCMCVGIWCIFARRLKTAVGMTGVQAPSSG